MAYVTLFESDNRIGKFFEIDEEGQPIKNQEHFSEGSAEKVQINTPKDFKNLLQKIDTYNCTCYGTSNKFHIDSEETQNKIEVYSKGRLKQLLENVWGKDKETFKDKIKYSVSRTRENFSFPSDEGWLLIDYDPPKDYQEDIPVKEELLELFYEIMPSLKFAPHLWTISGSSNVWKYADVNEDGSVTELQKPYQKDGVKGQRIYILVDKMDKIPQLMNLIEENFWLNGYGWVEVNKSGNFYFKVPMDISTGQPERLDYCAGLIKGSGFKQIKSEDDFFVINNNEIPLNIDDLITKLTLTSEEKEEISTLKKNAKRAAEPKADLARRSWAKEQVKKHEEAKNNPLKQIELEKKYYESTKEKALFSEFILHTERFGQVTVDQMLNNPQKYHNATMLDPFEPDYMGGDNYRIAKINLFPRGGDRPHIYCFAHGNIKYDLYRDHAEIEIQPDNFDIVMKQSMDMMVNNRSIYCYAGGLFQINEGELFELSRTKSKMILSGSITYFNGVDKEGNRKKVTVPSEVRDGILDLKERFSEFTLLKGFFRHPVLLDCDDDDVINNTNDDEEHDHKSRLLLKHDRIENNEKKYILSEFNGYDKKCNMFVQQHKDANQIDWNYIMKDFNYNPSEEQCLEAFEILWKAHSLYRFADSDSISFAIASILTAINRPAIDKCPMLLVKAPSVGSGKTKFCQTLGYIMEGKTVPVNPPFNTDEEFDKIMVGVFKKGKLPVIFDNCDKTIQSASLATILTGKSWENRALGTNENLEFKNTVFIMATGNGIDVVKDLVRRCMVIDINSVSDNPANEQFPFDPEVEVNKNYAEIVRAGLTLINAARKHKINNILNSFEEWSNTVARTVDFIGKNLINKLPKDSCFDSVFKRELDREGKLHLYENMSIEEINQYRDKRFKVRNPCSIIAKYNSVDSSNADIGEFFKALFSKFGKSTFKTSDLYDKRKNNMEYYPFATNEEEDNDMLTINKNSLESDDAKIIKITSKEFVMEKEYDKLLVDGIKPKDLSNCANRYNKQVIASNFKTDFPEFTGANREDCQRAFGHWLKEHVNKKANGFELLLIEANPKRGNRFMINIYDENKIIGLDNIN